MFWLVPACALPQGATDASDSVDTGCPEHLPECQEDGDPGTELALGQLSGTCPALTEVWRSSEPEAFRNAIDLFNGFDDSLLSEGGTTIWTNENLGGSSKESEVVAFEVLHGCEGADLLATEAELEYSAEGKKGDLLVDVEGHPLLVSVTRGFNYPDPDAGITDEAATELLEKKLTGLQEATQLLVPDHHRALLHVLAYGENDAKSLDSAWAGLDPEISADLLLMVTVTNGDDSALY